MSFRAREFVKGQQSKPRIWDRRLLPEDHAPEKLAGLLAAVDEALRERLPAEFERVDQIKRRPGWKPFPRAFKHPRLLPVVECPWCGDWFVQERHDHQKNATCSHACGQQWRAYKMRNPR